MRHQNHPGRAWSQPAYDDHVQDTAFHAGNGPKPLRRDAARNRELILATAAEAFAEHGLDVGYDEIARRAGFGVGTVYRRFPARSELISALFEARMDEVVALAETAAAQPDPWLGLCNFLERALEMQAADRGLTEALAGSPQHGEDASQARTRLVPALTRLLDGAKKAGRLRNDVHPSDLGVLMMVLSSLSTAEQPELYRRYLGLVLDGLPPREEGTPPLPLAAPGDDEMMTLMHGPSHRRH